MVPRLANRTQPPGPVADPLPARAHGSGRPASKPANQAAQYPPFCAACSWLMISIWAAPIWAFCAAASAIGPTAYPPNTPPIRGGHRYFCQAAACRGYGLRSRVRRFESCRGALPGAQTASMEREVSASYAATRSVAGWSPASPGGPALAGDLPDRGHAAERRGLGGHWCCRGETISTGCSENSRMWRVRVPM